MRIFLQCYLQFFGNKSQSIFSFLRENEAKTELFEEFASVLALNNTLEVLALSVSLHTVELNQSFDKCSGICREWTLMILKQETYLELCVKILVYKSCNWKFELNYSLICHLSQIALISITILNLRILSSTLSKQTKLCNA